MATILSTKTSGVGGLTVTGDASGVLQLASANGTTAVTIDASQNVGIGTSSPSFPLQVQTTAEWGIALKLANTSPTARGLTLSQRALGTIASPLTVTNGTIIGGFDAGGYNGTAYTFGYNGGAGIQAIATETWTSISNASALTFYTNSSGSANYTERMRIDSSGNVGIGTSSPARALTVYTTPATDNNLLLKSGAANAYLTFADSGTTDQTGLSVRIGSAGNAMVFNTGGTSERMRISSAGIVTMNAYGAGAATFSAAGVISSVSDETWKIKDGVPVDADSMLKKLEPGYWFYNEEKAPIFGTDRQLGFYAQNVNEAIGIEAAPTPEEGKPWGYYDRSVLAVTVMSLQKALATIEVLTARLTALEALV